MRKKLSIKKLDESTLNFENSNLNSFTKTNLNGSITCAYISDFKTQQKLNKKNELLNTKDELNRLVRSSKRGLCQFIC
jgi:hypothetical protein